MKKIVHIITGLGDGGAEAVLYRMVSSNDSPQEHIVICLQNKSKYGIALENKKIKVFYMNMSPNLKIFSKIYKLFLILKNLKPDAIQTWMYHSDLIGGITGRLSGCKNIVWGVYCSNFVFGQTKISTILIIFINALISWFLPKKIISCSDTGKDTHKRYGFAGKKLVYVPNGLPHEDFIIDKTNNFNLRESLNINNKEVVIGIVGRYSPMKDHLNFIKALSILKTEINDFVALFIGENLDTSNKTLMNHLEQYDLIDKVRLLGKRNNIQEFMNLIDINVLSSSFGEGQPNVLCESMLCGTPCVTTDVGDASLIVQDYGWVVPPKSPKLLFDAILNAKDLMNDASSWERRIIEGRINIINRFSMDRMTESYREIWQQ